MACSNSGYSKDRLFVAVNTKCSKHGFLEVSIESYIVTLVFCYCDINCIDVYFVDDQTLENTLLVSTDAQDKINAKVIDRQFLSQEIQDCKLPAVQSSDSLTCVSGLCSVLRWSLKAQSLIGLDQVCKHILGFRGGCLSACSEVSVWTKFCEVDFPKSVEELMTARKKISTEDTSDITVPEQLVRFEHHLIVPVRTHNILKRKQDIMKNHHSQEMELEECFTSLDLNGMKKDCTDLQLQHSYAEGIDKTLSDLVLWPCIHIHFNHLKEQGVNVESFLPHVCKWYSRLCADQNILKASELVFGHPFSETQAVDNSRNVIVPIVAQESLYSRDPTRSKTRVRHHDPSQIIEKLKEAGIDGEMDSCPSGMEEGLDWHNLPLSVHPAGGDLPLSRVERKCQQVESMVLATMDLAHPGDKIVDFCSGGGHVGLLLAYYLPKCQIILIENKEASLERARTRARNLDMDNVIFYQCNLDYFQGKFNVAISLHACGVATDLVIDKCLSNRASLVCCPCCYGSVKQGTAIAYPRSSAFKTAGITEEEYMQLCHFADRTEIDTPTEHQGKLCMALVDHDRCAQIREQNYEVQLCTLQPPDCTPKSNLIIAVPQK